MIQNASVRPIGFPRTVFDSAVGESRIRDPSITS